MEKKDYIIEGDVFVAYIGKQDIVDFEIPDGVRVIKKGIFQQTVGSSKNGIKVKIPASVEVIETCAFNNCHIKSFEIAKDAHIKTIGDSNNYDMESLIDEIVLPVDCDEYSIGWLRPNVVKVPKGCKVKKLRLWLSRNTNLILPKMDLGVLEMDSFPASETHTRANLFYGGEIPDEYRNQLSSFSYVYENIDTENIEYVDELKGKGISYFKTDKGIIVNALDNAKAKFEDLPAEYDGMPILDWNLVLFKEKSESFSSASTRSEKMTSNLYPKLKYYANKEEENFDLASREYFDYRKARMSRASSQSSSSNDEYSVKFWLRIIFCFGLPIVVTVLMAYLKHENIIHISQTWEYLLCNMIWPSLFIYFFVFNIPIFVIRMIKFIISKSKQRKIVKNAKADSNASTVENVGGVKHSPKLQIIYNHMQPKNVNRAYFLIKEQEEKLAISERKLADAQADVKRALNNYIHGTSEERAQREISNKLDTLNKNISESNKNSSSGSYDVYDNEGSYIGRIDKKD